MAGGKDEDLMTRREVAEMFHASPQVAAYWALRKQPPLLTEVRTAGNKPRYRRSEVQALWDSGFRW
jgi:hypothetical protein